LSGSRNLFYAGSAKSSSTSDAAAPLGAIVLASWVAAMVAFVCVKRTMPVIGRRAGATLGLHKLAANQSLVLASMAVQVVVFTLLLVSGGVNTLVPAPTHAPAHPLHAVACAAFGLLADCV